ncbi:hypothetical protein [Neisseria bergeri]
MGYKSRAGGEHASAFGTGSTATAEGGSALGSHSKT